MSGLFLSSVAPADPYYTRGHEPGVWPSRGRRILCLLRVHHAIFFSGFVGSSAQQQPVSNEDKSGDAHRVSDQRLNCITIIACPPPEGSILCTPLAEGSRLYLFSFSTVCISSASRTHDVFCAGVLGRPGSYTSMPPPRSAGWDKARRV